MKNLLKLPALLLLVLMSQLTTSCVASAQTVAVRPYYRPYEPYYYRPRPARVVVVEPAPLLVRPRPIIVAPRPYYYNYNVRPHRYIRVR